MNPLEQVILQYIHSVDGDYEQVEPQVYDIMIPQSKAESLHFQEASGIHRISFDAEAIADYPSAQLMAFGHPTLDAILEASHEQGRIGKIYLSGYNLTPHRLMDEVKKSLRIPKELAVEWGVPQPLYYKVFFFWFQAAFASDEKFQNTFEVGIDQFYGRMVRRLQELCDNAAITSESPYFFPDAGGISLLQAYTLARQEAISKLRSVAHLYEEKLVQYRSKETAQIASYFKALREELKEKKNKMRGQSMDDAMILQQAKSLDLEEQARLLELNKKMALKVELKLLNCLTVVQPKIRIPLRLNAKKSAPIDTLILWNPHTAGIDPIACPSCKKPTRELVTASISAIGCPSCCRYTARDSKFGFGPNPHFATLY